MADETNSDKARRGEAVSLTMDRLKQMQHQAIDRMGYCPPEQMHWHWAAAINELIALRSAASATDLEGEK
jgi:hypothetical protein